MFRSRLPLGTRRWPFHVSSSRDTPSWKGLFEPKASSDEATCSRNRAWPKYANAKSRRLFVLPSIASRYERSTTAIFIPLSRINPASCVHHTVHSRSATSSRTVSTGALVRYAPLIQDEKDSGTAARPMRRPDILVIFKSRDSSACVSRWETSFFVRCKSSFHALVCDVSTRPFRTSTSDGPKDECGRKYAYACTSTSVAFPDGCILRLRVSSTIALRSRSATSVGKALPPCACDMR